MFCEKCGALLTPAKKGKKVVLVCTKCKKRSKASGIIKEKAMEKKDKIVIVESEERELPRARVECPSCGHMEAFFWLVQTRAADEPPTKFFECIKCKNRWRSYS